MSFFWCFFQYPMAGHTLLVAPDDLLIPLPLRYDSTDPIRRCWAMPRLGTISGDVVLILVYLALLAGLSLPVHVQQVMTDMLGMYPLAVLELHPLTPADLRGGRHQLDSPHHSPRAFRRHAAR